MASTKPKKNIEIVNRKASFSYFFEETYEAGVILLGTEIKSLRAGNANLTDAYCYFEKGELYIKNMYIKEYEFGNIFNHEARRDRKLLLKHRELKKMEKKVKERGYTIIPYRLYFGTRGFVKLEIALASGKKTADKRDSIREKDSKREMDRTLKSIKF
ncbi:MAG: SsrA-binding protein SmpB [Saprospiraceae bacterium]|nr:SsrA-binding protein SmpB [Saprospiraceae bacterium]